MQLTSRQLLHMSLKMLVPLTLYALICTTDSVNGSNDLADMYNKCMQVKPSVLHGDLWSGNISGVEGEPSIFDPAVYYGHSEADFGMSWCAGFSSAFYDAYFRVLPKAPGQCLCPVFALCPVQAVNSTCAK